MYNDKNRQDFGDLRQVRSTRMPIGRSCPTFADKGGESRSDIPRVDDRIGKRLCDGSLQGNDMADDMNGCGGDESSWGLRSHPLAMVFSPLNEFRDLYTPDVALQRGTLFAELDLPFEGDKNRKGVC